MLFLTGMALPLAPFGAAHRACAAWWPPPTSWPPRRASACWRGAARPPTPPSPPAPPWRSWARTCAGSGATCWPWCRRRRSPPEALLSIGRAGAGSDAERLRREGTATMPVRGDIRSVQVPGAVDGWLALHERYGRLPLARRAGAGRSSWPRRASRPPSCWRWPAISSTPCPAPASSAPSGPLDIGQTVRLPGIARTLRAIARRRARRLLPGRVRAGPARPGRRPLRAGRLRHQRGVVVHAAARHGLGPRAVDRAAALAGLPDAGRRRGGRGGRARRRSRRSRSGPISSSRRGAPSATTARPCSTTARTARRSSIPSAWPPPPPASSAARHGAARRGAPAAAAAAGRRRGPPGRRRHHAPVRAGRRRPRHLADAVQRAGLRLAPRRAHHRRLPAQPRRGLLARSRATRPRWHPAGDRRTPSPPCSSPARDGGADPPGRGHGRRRPAADHRAAAGPPAALPGTIRPAPSRRPASPSTPPRPGPSASGGARTSPWWWRRTLPRPGRPG